MPFLQAAGRRIEYQRIPGPADRPVMVFLHEGLGSIAMWRDFPARCAAAAGCAALVYSRYGYGKSEEVDGLRQPDFMHVEALHALPEILDQFEIERPILVGHSDGASIALIHAGVAGRAVTGVIALAPHVFVEPKAIQSISDIPILLLREKLARFHGHVDSMFKGWRDIWLSPEFADWNIEEYLAGIQCPVLAVQGEQDEYGTMAQLDHIAERVPQLQQLRLDDCGHFADRDQPERVIEAVCEFAAIAPRGTTPDA